jgi:hypothetical protein
MALKNKRRNTGTSTSSQQRQRHQHDLMQAAAAPAPAELMQAVAAPAPAELMQAAPDVAAAAEADVDMDEMGIDDSTGTDDEDDVSTPISHPLAIAKFHAERERAIAQLERDREQGEIQELERALEVLGWPPSGSVDAATVATAEAREQRTVCKNLRLLAQLTEVEQRVAPLEQTTRSIGSYEPVD